jgi:hypothetical protein
MKRKLLVFKKQVLCEKRVCKKQSMDGNWRRTVPTNSLLFHTAEEIRKERYKKE